MAVREFHIIWSDGVVTRTRAAGKHKAIVKAVQKRGTRCTATPQGIEVAA